VRALDAFLFSSHPKGEKDSDAHLNYYASAYNRGRQLSHRKTKLKKYDKNKQASLTNYQQKKLKPGLVTSYDIQPGSRVGLFW